MKTIGLVRHFKVIQSRPKKKWMTSIEFDAWVEEYDNCDVNLAPSLIDSSEWDMCMSSDLSRAVVTSKQLYNDDIIYTEQLREIKIKSFFNTNIKLHYSLWLIIGRITWFIHKSQPEGKQETIERVRDILDQIEQLNVSNLLVVSHGALMWYIRKELRRRRYKGPIFIKPKNGKLYTFHK
jgi:broad specificity phosphatase PhoE